MPIHAEELLGTTPIPPPGLLEGGPIPELNYTQIDPGEQLSTAEYYEIRTARVPALDDPITVKQTRRRRTVEPAKRDALYQEGKRATQVCDHPYVVTIYGYGNDQLGWIAMEHLAGGSLDDLRNEMALPQRLWTAFAVIDAVHHANSMGFTHRDVSPSNVLFEETPGQYWAAPKLIDWGQARENHDRTRPDAITERYAAPELTEGTLPGRRLNRADVFQVSMVVYELLTGRLPDSYGENVAPPSELAAVPSQLDDPIRRALEFDPDDRLSPSRLRHAFQKAVRQRLPELLEDDGGESTSSTTKSTRTEGRDGSEGRDRTDETKPTPPPQVDEHVELAGAWPAYRGSIARTGSTAASTAVGGFDPVWQFETDAEVRSSVALGSERAFFGCGDGTVYALDAETGELDWDRTGTSAFNASPAVSDHAVYVGGRDKTLYAHDRSSGAERWQYETNMWVDSSPVVYDGSVFVGSNDFRLYALDAEDGSFEWEYDTGGEIGASSPAVADNTVYIAGGSGTLSAVDRHTGIERWSFDTQFSLPTTPAVTEQHVYVGSSQNRLYAVDADDGSRSWVFHTAGAVESAPAVWEDTVVFGAGDGTLHAVDETGTERWSQSLGQRILSDPIVVGTTVIVGCCDDNVYALDVRDGQPIDRFDTGGWVTTSPAFADGRVYVGAVTGVHCLELTR